MTDIAVIIVGLNASPYLKACLESLGQTEWRHWTHEVIYVDNGSTDDTLAMMAANFPAVRVLANATNLGFCKASNLGAAMARSRYYCFLNDDTVLRKDSIGLLAEALENIPEVGVIASRLVFPDLTEQYSGRRFPSIANGILGRRSFLTRIFPNSRPVSDYLYKQQLNNHDPFPAEWVSAAAMMVSKETFAMVGGFAEDYYYWHEAVICDRVRRKRETRSTCIPAPSLFTTKEKVAAPGRTPLANGIFSISTARLIAVIASTMDCNGSACGDGSPRWR